MPWHMAYFEYKISECCQIFNIADIVLRNAWDKVCTNSNSGIQIASTTVHSIRSMCNLSKYVVQSYGLVVRSRYDWNTWYAHLWVRFVCSIEIYASAHALMNICDVVMFGKNTNKKLYQFSPRVNYDSHK